MKLFRLLLDSCVPIYALSLETDNQRAVLSAVDLFINFRNEFSDDIVGYEYRAVSVDRLDTVLETGIDVVPADAPIYCESLQKAMEYGHWPKVVTAYHPHGLDRTFREVAADTQESELLALLEIFPTMERSKDGSMLWLSRLTEDDRRRCSGYEIAYARWIPGDPWESLRLILLVAQRQADLDPLLPEAVRTCIAGG